MPLAVFAHARQQLVNDVPHLDRIAIARSLRILPPRFVGKARLGRLILGSRLESSDIVIECGGGSRFLVPCLREPVAFELLINGAYESETLALLLKAASGNGVFVDVGANIGAFTVPLAKQLNSGTVVAIEASPAIYPYLARNIELNDLRNIRLHHCAAFDHDLDTVAFYEAPKDHFGMGALVAQFSGEAVPVTARTLDSILAQEGIDRVDVLKVDVEGFEGQVFAGATKLLAGSRAPTIVFEFCDWAERRVQNTPIGHAQRFLLDLGYSIYRLTDFMSLRPQPLRQPLIAGYEQLVAYRS
jgi:FkbM family methyltransferase